MMYPMALALLLLLGVHLTAHAAVLRVQRLLLL